MLWLGLAACLVALRVILPAEDIESLYSRGLYPHIRRGLDGVFGWWPVPASAVILVLFVALILYDLRRQLRKAFTFASKMGRAALSLFRAVSIVVVAFMLLWGFNYGRVPLDQHLNIETRTLATEELWQELEQTAKFVSILRTQLPVSDTSSFESLPLSQGTEGHIRHSLRQQLLNLNLPAANRVRVRQVVPGGLLHFNTSGVYFPLTGEAHVDAGLHSLQVPFVMAHEMSHGYGITDEGACNFLAWLACTRADNLYIRYAGHLTYLRYVGAAVRRRDPEGYRAFRQNLPRAVLADLQSIANNLNRYTEIAPRVRDAVYDSYLKSQGIADGMASYSRIIDLVAAWKSGPRVPRVVKTANDRPLR